MALLLKDKIRGQSGFGIFFAKLLAQAGLIAVTKKTNNSPIILNLFFITPSFLQLNFDSLKKVVIVFQ